MPGQLVTIYRLVSSSFVYIPFLACISVKNQSCHISACGSKCHH